MYKTKITSPL